MVNNNFNPQEKIMCYTNKLDYFYNSGKTLVVTELDLTNRCNNLCPKCSSSTINKDRAQLSWEQLTQIIAGLKELDNKGVILSGGGEPLMYPHFLDALRLISNSGMKIGINTNGLALSREKALAIVNHCIYCRVSLDAGSPAMYKQTHGMDESAYNKVLYNIRTMASIIRETNSQISFGAGFLTSKETISDMEPFVVLCKEQGLQFAQFRPFTGDSTDITEMYSFLKDKYEDDNFKVLASIQKYKEFSSGGVRTYDKCRGMFFSTCVTADAKVFACIHHRQNEKYKIGEIGIKTLVEVWNSYNKWRVFENIDLENDCPLYCRNDSFNRTLESMSKNVAHSEFL